MKHIKLFESFDRYDFKSLYNSDEIYKMIGDLKSDWIDFNESEIEKIQSILGYKQSYSKTSYKIILRNNLVDNRKNISIYSVGDYVYVLSYGGYVGGKYIYDESHVIDDIDNLLEKIEELL